MALKKRVLNFISQRPYLVLNILVFQVGWATAVNFKNNALLLLVAFIAMLLAFSPIKTRDFLLMSVVAIIGLGVDAVISAIGIFHFDNKELLPLWLVALWCLFALTLNHSMAWLQNISNLKICLLGIFGGTSSYASASALGAVDLPYGWAVSLTVIAISWALMLPAFIQIALQLKSMRYLQWAK